MRRALEMEQLKQALDFVLSPRKLLARREVRGVMAEVGDVVFRDGVKGKHMGETHHVRVEIHGASEVCRDDG